MVKNEKGDYRPSVISLLVYPADKKRMLKLDGCSYVASYHQDPENNFVKT